MARAITRVITLTYSVTEQGEDSGEYSHLFSSPEIAARKVGRGRALPLIQTIETESRKIFLSIYNVNLDENISKFVF